nr:unnamed protein product [Haemonchus contortus]
MNMTLDGPNYHSPTVRDPTVPLPPGVVVVQIIQPSAPPLSPPHQPQQLSLPLYPRLPPLDQNYADQQMAIQK